MVFGASSNDYPSSFSEKKETVKDEFSDQLEVNLCKLTIEKPKLDKKLPDFHPLQSESLL